MNLQLPEISAPVPALITFTRLLVIFMTLTTMPLYAQIKLWDQRYGGSMNDELSIIIRTSDGGYLLGGSSLSGYSSA